MKNNDILQLLSVIEKNEEIEILYACEIGSRVWGFANEDSDNDIRFIYKKRTVEDYLSLKNSRDVIEYRGDNVDIVGWDIKKTLNLYFKNNPSLREMLMSNQTYIDTGVLDVLDDLGEFDRNVLKNHYLSIALRHWKKYCGLKFDMTKTKKYLYVIRAILCWKLLDNDIYPPISINELINHQSADISDETKGAVQDLIGYHQGLCEINEETIFKLNNFILNSFKDMEKVKVESGKDICKFEEKFRQIVLENEKDSVMEVEK